MRRDFPSHLTLPVLCLYLYNFFTLKPQQSKIRLMPDGRDDCSIAAPNARVTGFTINSQGGFIPTLSKNNCLKDKLECAIDLLDGPSHNNSNNRVFVCVQEGGFTSDVPPPSVTSAVHRAHMSIKCAGSRKGKAASVAIMAAKGWRFAKVFGPRIISPPLVFWEPNLPMAR